MPLKPRLIDLFGTGPARQVAASLGPPLKRVAPRRGDPTTDARALARAADAYAERLSNGDPMPKYQMALDAAPQDGRWLDDPGAVKTALMFLLSKLPPDQLAELDGHLTEGTEPQATDHRLPEGNLKRDFLNYTPRNRRAMLDTLASAPRRGTPLTVDEMRRTDPDAAKSFEDRFPNASRLTG